MNDAALEFLRTRLHQREPEMYWYVPRAMFDGAKAAYPNMRIRPVDPLPVDRP